MSRRHGHHPVLVTDAAASFEDQLRCRRRRYATLMAVHIAGFALAGVLYYVAWWLGLVLMITTGVLPWIAVVVANDSPPRGARTPHLMHRRAAARELEGSERVTVHHAPHPGRFPQR